MAKPQKAAKPEGDDVPLEPSAQDKRATRKARRKARRAAPGARIRDLAQPQSATDAMVASIADQLCAIVDDNYDFRVKVDAPDGGETLQVQKLTVLINSLLENVRRSIGNLSELAEELESKVKERTQKLDLIVQSSNDGVWLWNLQTGDVEYSSRWRQLLGLDNEALSRIEDWLGRVHPDDQERLRSAIRAHLQGSNLYLREDYRIQHSDGTYRWVWCRGRCHRDESGRPVMMAGTQTDVHQLRSLDVSTGLPNEQSLMASLEDLTSRGIEFRAMVIGVPRVVSMKEDMASDDLSMLRGSIARRLSASLPFSAVLAHLSGDFYAVVLPVNCSDTAIQADLLDPLLDAFDRPFRVGRRTVELDVAVGVTMPIKTSSQTASDIMRDAWTSYRCARSAGARCNILSEQQLEDARDRMNIQQEVRRGLQRDWFVPYFQPIVDIRTQRLLGFETLCRMAHPELGVISPGRFIPVAEDLGVMDDISLRMLDRALVQLADWAAHSPAHRDLFLTVNLEAHQIMQPDFIETLVSRLERDNIPPQNLKIEIVESSMVGNFSAAAQKIAEIRDVGVKIALDDFGTGYSSLEYLNQLSFDLIKIDKAFVDDVETDPRKHSMIKMICVLAETLDAEICVEGIENQAQADLMSKLNVAYGQGYLFSKPIPREAMANVLSSWEA
ncbi:putative bifunctional diguanylate cyclase/phosphodiesterase [Tateyamaria sp. SN6-1]|uniref:putative bifunctional diguanylate cyclase/phosphodiesterase n=1 Tax=Tateyamaria sp. SN6-1 TaxID=3092148 RepID=UPI0039F50488